MANIELNYYNGANYEILYPKVNLNNNDSTVLSTTYIPNLSASKITSGTLSVSRGGTGVTSYSSLWTQLSSYVTIAASCEIVRYTGTGTSSTRITFPKLTQLAYVIFFIPNSQTPGIGWLNSGAGIEGFMASSNGTATTFSLSGGSIKTNTVGLSSSTINESGKSYFALGIET